MVLVFPEAGASKQASEARPEGLAERFGDPGGPDPGEATSSAASASLMRERAAQKLNPETGRMGAEAPAMEPLAETLVLLPWRSSSSTQWTASRLQLWASPDSASSSSWPPAPCAS